MFHLLKYRLLSLLRNKSLVFWTFVFPLILSTLFGLTLKNAYNTETFKAIDVAVIQRIEYDEDPTFKTFIETISNEGGLLKVILTSEQEAKSLLANNDITGIIDYNDTIKIMVNSNGLNQTILKSIFDEYQQKSAMISSLIQSGADYSLIMKNLTNTTSYVQLSTPENTDLSSVFFYTIIAMTSLYGGNWIMQCSHDTQVHLSRIGARVNVSSVKKSKFQFVDFIVANLIQGMIMLILLLYLIFVIQVNFGPHLLEIALTIICGILAGSSLGLFISVAIKQSLDTKNGLLIGITMLCSFLSGMMDISIKYYVQVYAPILSKINPATMITDALYTLYYYGADARFYSNILSLITFSIVLYTLSLLIIRRKEYARL